MVLDLVLAELDGFQFATAARAQPWGANLPLVVVSGVYKQLPQEFAARVKPAAFFAKPFEPAALRATLARLTGAQPGAPAMEGELSTGREGSTLHVDHLKGRAPRPSTCWTRWPNFVRQPGALKMCRRFHLQRRRIALRCSTGVIRR